MTWLLFAVAYSHSVLLCLYVFGDASAYPEQRARHVALACVWPLVVAYACAKNVVGMWRRARETRERK